MDEMKRMLEVIVSELGVVRSELGTVKSELSALKQEQVETNQRLDKLETRMGTMESRMGGMETDVKEVKQTVTKVDSRVDSVAILLGEFVEKQDDKIEEARLEWRQKFAEASLERAQYARITKEAHALASYSAAFAKSEELRRQAK